MRSIGPVDAEAHVNSGKNPVTAAPTGVPFLRGEALNRTIPLPASEGEGRAWNLCGRMGFVELLRQHRFGDDPRPHAVPGTPRSPVIP